MSPTFAGILLLLAAQGVATLASADQPASPALPVAMPIERYKTMIERSPFAVASQTAPPPAAEAAGFAKDLVLTGAVRLGTGEYITIASRGDPTQRFGLKTGETYNGIAVVSVAWSDAVGKTKVTLKCGSEYGVVSFDEATLNISAAPMPPAGVPFSNNGQPILPTGVTLPNAVPLHPPGAVVNPPANPGASPSRRPRIIRSIPPVP